MEDASEYLEVVRGPAVAKGAVLGIVEDVPFAGIEYVPGRTLDRLFSGEGQGSIPLPVEHALLIAEKLLVALEAGKPFEKKMGAPHGFLTPGFVSISNDGDVRVYGAGLGAGLLPSLKKPAVLAAFGPYIAPEVLASGKPSGAGDIYSAATILLQALTGKVPSPGRRHRRPLRSGPRRRREPDAGGPRQAPRPGPREGPGPARDGRRRLQEDPRQAPLRRPLRPFDVQPRLLHAPAVREGDREGTEGAGAGRDDRPEAARGGRGEEGQGGPRSRPGGTRGGSRRPLPPSAPGPRPGTTTMGGTPVSKKSGLGGIPVPARRRSGRRRPRRGRLASLRKG